MKKSFKIFSALILSSTMAFGLGATIFASQRSVSKTEAIYSPSTHYEVSDTASELASYYSSITDSMSGTSLLSALQSLNSSKRKKTIGYSTMGTSTSGAFIYTDYDLNSTATDSNGQKYGTKVASFYTKTASTSWNREHVWPDSRGGGTVDADILMTRPTITSENSSRGNSFYVEGMNHSSNGWDPYTAGYDIKMRGECARIILYCVVANPSLSLSDASTIASGATGYTKTMGDMDTLIKWHFDYSPNVYEMNRNNGAEYLQGNRNPFVDHPEYVAKIWSNFNSNVSSICSSHSTMYNNWTAGSYSTYGTNDQAGSSTGGSETPVASISVSATRTSFNVGETTTLTATKTNLDGTVQWYVEDSSTNVITLVSTSGDSITVNGVGAGIKKVYAYVGTVSTSISLTVTNNSSGGGSTTTGTAMYTVSSTSAVTSSGTVPTSSNASYSQTFSTAGQITKGKTATLTLSGYAGNKITGITLNMHSNKSDGAGTFSAKAGSTTLASIDSATTFNKWYDNTSYGTNDRDITVTMTNANYEIKSNESVVILISGTTNSLYINSYTIAYESSSSGSTATLSSITLASNKKTSYYTGDEFVKPAVTAHYSDDTTADVTSATTFTQYDLTIAGSYTVKASYTEGSVTQTATYDITVTAKTVTSLTLTGTPSKTTYYEGEGFDPNGLTVTATYNDDTSENVANDVVWTPDPLTTNTTSVTGTFGGKTVIVNGITVNSLILSSIAVTNATTTYYINGSFVKPTVTATYNNGSASVVTDLCEFSGYDMSVAGSYTVTVTYTEKSVTKTTTYSITVQNGKSSMQEAYEACAALATGGTTSNSYTFTGTIAATQGNSFFVQDGDYGMMVYGGKTSYASATDVGHLVTVNATLQNYGGLFETKTITSVDVSTETSTVVPKPVTSYDSISNLSQSILADLSSGVVKTVPTGDATSDMSFVITVGGQDITVFGSRHNSNAADLNNVCKGLSVGDYISISNMETSMHSSVMQLALTEQTTVTKGYSLGSFCLEFLNNLTCDATGSSAPTYATNYSWSQLSTLYANLSSEDQLTLKNATANERGTQYEQVAARYDYIVAKYGYENFMNRTITNSANRMNLFKGTSTNNILLILGSISLLGGLTYLAYFLKKRKEN